jgi:5-formyltetrahydrofolate cyclo-ligase
VKTPVPATTDVGAPDPRTDRAHQRLRLLATRASFMLSPQGAAAQAAIEGHLQTLIRDLEPVRLGLYWPVRGEFSAGVSPWRPLWASAIPLALPNANKLPPAGDGCMVYRGWVGPEPQGRDAVGLPTSQGPVVMPDVLLVPCVGFTASGWRLGYGGGYFDRYLARHPGMTTVGVAWSQNELPDGDWRPEPHDQALTIVVTERGVV